MAQVGGVLSRCRSTLGHNTSTARPFLRNINFLQRNCIGNFVIKVKQMAVLFIYKTGIVSHKNSYCELKYFTEMVCYIKYQ